MLTLPSDLMSATVNFVIRDGLARDIPDCLLLDHTYETE